MLDTPFAPWPCYTSEEAEAVTRILLSNRVNYWTGTECRDFEREFADWVGTEHAVSLINGTFALEIALRALGVSSGDDVIVTPRSFVASASCIVSLGARPVFADVDTESQNITAETVRNALTPHTRAIICVHLGGMPCDMDPIMALAEEHGLKVIEDCAQAHGAKYRGKMVGSLGHIGAWSFCQDKIMTTGGEGGMVTTNDRELWSWMWSYKDHGKSWEAVYERKHPAGFRWLHESFGTNGRMLEIQAAIGRIQLRRMPDWTARRTANATRLARILQQFSAVRIAAEAPDIVNAYYRLYAFVRSENLGQGWTRDRIVDEIVNRRVPCYHGTCSEMYLEKAFDGTDFRPAKELPVARSLGQTSLMFLVHPTLTDEQLEHACRVLNEVLSQASGGKPNSA